MKAQGGDFQIPRTDKKGTHAMQTRNNMLRTVTADYLAELDPKNIPDPSAIESDILDLVRHAIDKHNGLCDKSDMWKRQQELAPMQIAQIIAAVHDVCCISTNQSGINADYDLLAIYQTDGPNKGIYLTNEILFDNLARQYNYSITTMGIREVMAALKTLVPHVPRCHDRDLVAVNNGLFDYRTKTLRPFDPKYVFLSKSKVNYDPSAKCVTIHNETDGTHWDVESWMNSLSDDPQIVHVLWQILGAIIRPNVRWNKSAWLYSETGNNGKGTLCEMMRCLCGDGAYASISLDEFSSEFHLEPLTHASAIIVDENDVGSYIDKAANLKAVITNDVITINRKFKSPIAYQFYGFMVQCLNEFPRIRDKSGSFYRRQLFIPMEKCFTGAERRYIKTDYIHRDEVLEYVLFKVLNMDYYTLDEPDACKNVLDEYKEFNDPLRAFFGEYESEFKWDLLPFAFLYDLYRAWFVLNVPNGSPLGKNKFIKDLIQMANETGRWRCYDRRKTIRTGAKMDAAEPLIAQYKLRDWINPKHQDLSNVELACHPQTAPSYRGLVRMGAADLDLSDLQED